MGWRSKIPRRYTEAHMKVITILQEHVPRILFVTEEPTFPLSDKRGDQVVCDVYLTGDNLLPFHRDLRVECDDVFFKVGKWEHYFDEDRRLKAVWGVRTIRLNNRRVMLKQAGRRYVESLLRLGEWYVYAQRAAMEENTDESI